MWCNRRMPPLPVFLSLPCVLGENGVTHIVKQLLTAEEKEMLHNLLLLWQKSSPT